MATSKQYAAWRTDIQYRDYRRRLKLALVELAGLDTEKVRFSTIWDISRKYRVFRADLASAYGNPANWPLDNDEEVREF